MAAIALPNRARAGEHQPPRGSAAPTVQACRRREQPCALFAPCCYASETRRTCCGRSRLMWPRRPSSATPDQAPPRLVKLRSASRRKPASRQDRPSGAFDAVQYDVPNGVSLSSRSLRHQFCTDCLQGLNRKTLRHRNAFVFPAASEGLTLSVVRVVHAIRCTTVSLCLQVAACVAYTWTGNGINCSAC